jgi:murein DD-endopeptidase MepM/ murein hydrolase activator NlpD
MSNQRFAYDMLIRKDGKTWRAEPKAPSDFLAWDQPILAPADGTVASATDGLPDSMPGARDEVHKEGNVVIIDHGQGEWSMLAHLKQGSVRVKPGQHVKAGQEIGRCGSSGNATEPHLHVQLMNASDFWKAEGLPLPFTNLLVDGKPVEKAELVRGQMVSVGP